MLFQIGMGLLALIAVGLLWAMSTYNRLVQLQNQVKNSWSQIDVQLQRRYDLIPNLIESVKGYMNFERSTLEAVIQARNQAASAREKVAENGGPTGEGSIKQLAQAETVLKGAMTNFFALAENYPQLRASENMQQLQEELTSTENKIAFARQAYNDQTMVYNTSQQQFPANFIATLFGHHPAELFAVADEASKRPVKVQF